MKNFQRYGLSVLAVCLLALTGCAAAAPSAPATSAARTTNPDALKYPGVNLTYELDGKQNTIAIIIPSAKCGDYILGSAANQADGRLTLTTKSAHSILVDFASYKDQLVQFSQTADAKFEDISSKQAKLTIVKLPGTASISPLPANGDYNVDPATGKLVSATLTATIICDK